MGEPKRMFFPPREPGDIGYQSSGVDITYIKRRRTLSIGGWYDDCVGIENTEIVLGDFLRCLGITLGDCKKALEDSE